MRLFKIIIAVVLLPMCAQANTCSSVEISADLQSITCLVRAGNSDPVDGDGICPPGEGVTVRLYLKRGRKRRLIASRRAKTEGIVTFSRRRVKSGSGRVLCRETFLGERSEWLILSN